MRMTRRPATASAMARFAEVMVFPSPWIALVIRMDLGEAWGDPPSVQTRARRMRYASHTLSGSFPCPFR